ncbi:NlpC/P60 family protein [Mycolicibacterium sp. P9-64]|uniref:NlpC/P60 family peptidoglycan endopeptidase RipB n=1 Tax=Mycolicibacterium sp. P9-64 TaxID=2024612 RepID=UPI0011EC00F7|nr:NlpC/P60 family peptidoglycan endopeptidase RipB [Mycolicibacterium sp. P9-64]KAA0084281.1 NlpC/P60 family protein [Mycolicibacterium sp. P9-64]
MLLAALGCALGLMAGAAATASADPDGGAWDPTLPKVPSSGAPGDPVAAANAAFSVSQLALQTTQSLGSQFLQSIGLAPSPSAGANPGGRVRGPQAIEYVIRRGGSQMGVPYSWGGGALNGPSEGVDYDTGKIGYDCSGLTRYMFAGVGVQIPKYSGDQYNAGRPIDPSQAKRGDLIFYGPGGSQHVAMFLGGGRMLEASGSAGKVTVSPVRTAGMSPHLVRFIES